MEDQYSHNKEYYPPFLTQEWGLCGFLYDKMLFLHVIITYYRGIINSDAMRLLRKSHKRFFHWKHYFFHLPIAMRKPHQA